MKVLTEEGLKVLWNQISMEDYPNNDMLIAVLNAIDETKADRNTVYTKEETETFVNNTIAEAIAALPRAEEASF